jgi:hypothetical protein
LIPGHLPFSMAQEPKYNKTILCLANSRKMSGRCLAGKEITGSKTGAWVRPVSVREHQEISEGDRRYKDGHTANLLDIILIPMLDPRPGTYQSENHLIADRYYWKKIGTATWDQIQKALDTDAAPLWIDGFSSNGGDNDRIPEDRATKVKGSLLLVKPTDLKIIVAPKGDPNAPDKRSVRARFALKGGTYDLGLTDAAMETKYLKGKNGTFPITDAVLCISLGEPFKGYVYKLAAALITPDRVGKSDD